MSRPDVWFSDCEVFAEDVLWVFKSKRTGEIAWFHNDPFGVEEFLTSHENIWLCGYNFRDYDQYILKGTLLYWDNQQLKVLNDTLIFDGIQAAWDLLGYETVYIPPIIDLFHDIVPRKSLKEIEANIGMNIQETEVSFDLDRKLTDEEFDLTLKYCINDVEATEQLYYKRLDYIRTKKNLCDLAGLDDALMMKNTNARVVAEALHAEKLDPIAEFGVERYVDIMPEVININKLPREVAEYIQDIDSLSGWQNPKDSILFDFYNTPTVMGLGGIHASTGYIDYHVMKSGERKGEVEPRFISTPKTFESDDDTVVLIQDIGSFYPSMLIIFDYMSRAIPYEYRGLYEDFYKMRMEAKAAGDKETANAAKLVLNTKYGCMKNQYNKLFDPFKATCVCVTGQLLILDLMRRIQDETSTVEIVQLNTDGWVLSLSRSEYDTLNDIVANWSNETGFTVETDIISKMVQRDVNNYVIVFDNGNVKAKGGTVKNWKGGSFTSNTCSIVDTAIVKYITEGCSISDTIYSEMNMEPFQIVLKAGSTFDGCMRERDIGFGDKQCEMIHGKVHRIYAAKKKQYGWTYYKYKAGGNPARFPDTPDNCLEDFEIKSIDNVDKEWYNALAQKKLDAFLGRGEK